MVKLCGIKLHSDHCQCVGCSEGDVRLAGGMNYAEGRVEICINEEWGTVCDQMWSTTEASVVCRQLQFTSNGK